MFGYSLLAARPAFHIYKKKKKRGKESAKNANKTQPQII